MKRLPHLLTLCALALTLALPVRGGEDPVAVAIRLLDRMDAQDYAGAEAMFGPQMAAAVPAERLAGVWSSLPPAGTRGQAQLVHAGDSDVVSVPLSRGGLELVAKVVVDVEGKIVGFTVQPAAPAQPTAPPVPADARYTEREAQVGSGERALPATLSMPKGDGPFPAVVLVHGSGPHDRDESIGPNRPFLDIARGLAARGIAVLRYEKRSKARPQDLMGAQLDVDLETTDDAVQAVASLRATPGIDPARIFVLGHSQGALMAPRIAQRSGHVAGLVLFAAPARPLLDILVEQSRRLAVLDDGHTSPEEARKIAALEAQVKAVRDPEADADATALLNLPNRYWRSIDGVDPVAEARAVHLPMLVLQGARDIQVVDADWQRWKAAFHADPQVTFKLYPALNHLGIAGEGDGSLAEYSRPGHVDAQLVADVADWIGAHR